MALTGYFKLDKHINIRCESQHDSMHGFLNRMLWSWECTR